MSRAELLGVVLDFLEVAIHGLLCVTGVYPRDVFSARRAYGISVAMSRHPGVNRSVRAALQGLRAPLLAGSIECVVLTLLDARSGAALEAFPIDIDLGAPEEVPATKRDVEAMFAAALTRIMLLDSPAVRRGTLSGRDLDGGERTWTLHALAHEGCGEHSGALSSTPEWTRVDPGDADAPLLALRGQSAPGPTQPRWGVIKSVSAGHLRMQLRVMSTQP